MISYRLLSRRYLQNPHYTAKIHNLLNVSQTNKVIEYVAVSNGILIDSIRRS